MESFGQEFGIRRVSPASVRLLPERIVEMGVIQRSTLVFAIVVCGVFAWLAAPVSAQIVLAGSTPEHGAALDGPVRTVRVWFDQAPQLSKSTLAIAGPGNRAKVEGLHTMGENDLMGRVSGPMPDGEWTMRWTAVGADGEEQTGSITFTVERRR